MQEALSEEDLISIGLNSSRRLDAPHEESPVDVRNFNLLHQNGLLSLVEIYFLASATSSLTSSGKRFNSSPMNVVSPTSHWQRCAQALHLTKAEPL
jgi:hypothetical protein